MIIFIGGQHDQRRRLFNEISAKGRDRIDATLYQTDMRLLLLQSGIDISDQDATEDDLNRAVTLAEMKKRAIDASLLYTHDWSKILIVEGSFLDIINTKQLASDGRKLFEDVPDWFCGYADDPDSCKRVIHFLPIEESKYTIESRKQLQEKIGNKTVNTQFLAKHLSLTERCEKVLQFIEDNHLSGDGLDSRVPSEVSCMENDLDNRKMGKNW